MRVVLSVAAALPVAALLTGCAGAAAAPPAPRSVLAPAAASTRSQVVAALGQHASDELGRERAVLPLTAWSYDLRSFAPAPGRRATVHALLRYRLTADTVDATAARVLVVGPDPAHPGGLRVTSDRPDGAALPWDLGPVRWTGGTRADVIWADGSQPEQPTDLPAAAAAGARTVAAVWGRPWRGVPLVVAVRGPGALARLSGQPAGTGGAVAVTTVDRVYVDVTAYRGLSPEGRLVLLAHELTHLATGAAADPGVPQWLEEGFADYVGLRGSILPTAGVAGALLDLVRASGPPSRLPTDAAFTAGGPTQDRAYAGAWLACRLLAARVGERGLVAVYRATSVAARAAAAAQPGAARPVAARAAAAADRALLRVTGHGTAWWTGRWRAALAAEGARPGGAG